MLFQPQHTPLIWRRGTFPQWGLRSRDPSTKTLHVRSESEGVVYNPDPDYLMYGPKQTNFQADSFPSHDESAIGELLTDCAMVELASHCQ